MRLIHISDSHLGASGFSRRLSPSGFNQREEDICNSFQFAIDQIIELKPDIVLHTGDLFHTVRPTNRIINFAIRQILRVVNEDIPMVIISGNHDTPKQRTVGSVFSFFEVLSPRLHLVYRNQYELVKLDSVAIHAIPHCLDQEDFSREVAKVEIDSGQRTAQDGQNMDFNILMLHGVVAGIPEFSMGELAEQEIPSSYLEMPFDYVALGHYHRHCQVSSKGYYAGSTERLSMGELGQEKGFMEINLSTKETNFHPVPARGMIELPSISATDLNQEEILEQMQRRIQADDITDKIVRLKVRSIPEHIYNSLDFRRIGELKSKAFHFDLRFEKKEEESREQAVTTSIGKLNVEFEQFLKGIAVENLKKDRLLELGLRYLTVESEEYQSEQGIENQR
ncbi:MAG: exonuclease SbcCD subunit D [candidate division Zixibacteria bacterium]|nr:exonuclease SbcCD subunit D [candidate division Zixibacteria bacterium]